MANPYHGSPSGNARDGEHGGFIPRWRASHSSIAPGASPLAVSPANPPFSRLSSILSQPQDSSLELYTTRHSYIRSSSNNVHPSDGNLAPADGGPSGHGRRAAQLPSFSRAFEMFMSPMGGDSFWSSQHRHNGFFAPSYLQGSSYITKLEEVHKAKQALKETQPQTGSSTTLQTNQNFTASITTKPAAYMGLAYDLVERPPPFEDDDTIPPLPTRWNGDDKHGGLEVIADGQEVKYTAQKPPGERDHEAYAIRTDHAIPNQAGIYYYEITLMSRKRDE
jgi:Ran-binding protein 9/10